MKIPNNSPSLYNYEIFPRVAELNRLTAFKARGLGIDNALTPGREYTIYFIPREENNSSVLLSISDFTKYDSICAAADENGVIELEYTFKREQIYTLRLTDKDDGGKIRIINNFRIFCAAADLYKRTPMRGNLHCHTCKSVDGHEDPYLAAATYRRAGFDFLAITDHHNVDGSVFAIEKSKDIPSEMSLYYGEEVHVPNAYIHAVNVGALLPGGIGLDSYYHANEAKVKTEVAEIAAEYKDRLPENIEPYDFAWRKWIADTIHKYGGIAILAHPFWEWDANNTRDDVFRYLAKEKIYDAAEILHGQEEGCPDAYMAAAFWNDMRADGIFISPVGVDDAHMRYFHWSYESAFNWTSTMIFAKAPSFDGFAEAIRSGYSVATESYEDGPEHIVGTYRLTKYTLFLLDQYFPHHDELCFEEGCRMRDCYLGDEKSRKVLELINGRVKEYQRKFFGRE